MTPSFAIWRHLEVRLSRLATALIALAAAAAPIAAQRPRVTVILPGFRTPVIMDTVGMAREYRFPPARLFAAAAAAVAALKVAVELRDSVAGILGNLSVKTSRRWAGQQISKSLDCGVGIRGLHADVYRIHLAFVLLTRSVGSDRVELRVALAAGAQDFAGPLADHVSCSSTGGFEERVHQVVRDQLESAPSPRDAKGEAYFARHVPDTTES